MIVLIEPFTLNQNIYIFEDKILRMEAQVNMRDLPSEVVKLAEANHIKDIKLRGGVDFAQKIKEDIKEVELYKYSKAELNIELV